MLGAVAAWFGIVLLVGLKDLNILGDLIAPRRWPPSFDAPTIAFAFVLGFSERFLTTLLSAVEGKLPGQTGPPAPPAGTPAQPVGSPPKVPPGGRASGGGPASGGQDPRGGLPDAATARVISLMDLVAGQRVIVHGRTKSGRPCACTPRCLQIAGVVVQP
jgi:hypothetical protein